MSTPVYKFLPPSRASYLGDQLLRFSQPCALNDPFESANYDISQMNEKFISTLPSAFGDDSRAGLRRAGEIKKLVKELTAKFGEKFGVLSLSERWDSSLMWAHYTERHAGFCVGFDREHAFFATDTIQKTKLKGVTYGFSRIDFANELGGQSPAILFYKSIDWAYELELRMVFFWQREGPLRFTWQGKCYPDNVPVNLLQVPHEAISELIVGMEASVDLRREILTLGDRLNVPVFEAYPSIARLAVDRERI